jgi:hypothetical protein
MPTSTERHLVADALYQAFLANFIAELEAQELLDDEDSEGSDDSDDDIDMNSSSSDFFETLSSSDVTEGDSTAAETYVECMAQLRHSTSAHQPMVMCQLGHVQINSKSNVKWPSNQPQIAHSELPYSKSDLNIVGIIDHPDPLQESRHDKNINSRLCINARSRTWNACPRSLVLL